MDKTYTPSVTRDDVKASFMGRVYSWMCLGLLVTFIVAYFVSSNPAVIASTGSLGFGLIGVLILIGISYYLSSKIEQISPNVATILFLVYASLMGVFLSYIFLLYTKSSIATVFLMTAGGFGVLALYGYSTKKDLSGMAKFCFMVLIGLLIFGIVSIFFPSLIMGPMGMVYNIVGIFVFAGFTAYENQRLKTMGESLASQGEDRVLKYAIVAALSLYMNFINLFIRLLSLFGRRRD